MPSLRGNARLLVMLSADQIFRHRLRALLCVTALVVTTALAGCATRGVEPIDWTTLTIQVPANRELPMPASVGIAYQGEGEKQIGYLQPYSDRGITRYRYSEHRYDERALLLSFGKAALKHAFSEVNTAGQTATDLLATISADASVSEKDFVHRVAVVLSIRWSGGGELGSYRGTAQTRSARGFDGVALQNAYTLALFDAIEKIARDLPLAQ